MDITDTYYRWDVSAPFLIDLLKHVWFLHFFFKKCSKGCRLIVSCFFFTFSENFDVFFRYRFDKYIFGVRIKIFQHKNVGSISCIYLFCCGLWTYTFSFAFWTLENSFIPMIGYKNLITADLCCKWNGLIDEQASWTMRKQFAAWPQFRHNIHTLSKTVHTERKTRQRAADETEISWKILRLPWSTGKGFWLLLPVKVQLQTLKMQFYFKSPLAY